MGLRSGFDYLTTPPEIWLACWDLCEAEELRLLCLVCTHFRQICQPLLFRSQSVVSMIPNGDIGNAASRINRFHAMMRRLGSLASSPHASSVRVWNFMGPSHPADLLLHDDEDLQPLQEAWNGVLDKFASTLGSYRRVTVLDLRRLDIDAPFRGVLESLGLLEDLTLWECDIISRTGTLLPLKRLEIAGWQLSYAPDPIELVSPATLQSLEFRGSEDGDWLLTALSAHQLPQLHHISLTLTPVIADRFFAFLDSCPQLQSIKIRYHGIDFARPHLSDPVNIPSSLPASSITGLKSFSGPPRLAGIFVLGRPVEEVTLARPVGHTPANEIVADLEAISHGSIPLRSLSVGAAIGPPDTAEVFAAVAALFPALRALSVELKEETISESEYAVGFSESDEDGEFDPAEATSNDAEMAEASESSSSQPESPDAGERERAEDFIPVPGFMYLDWTGSSFPPLDCPKPEEGCSPLTIFMDSLATGVIVLPPRLEVLRFMQPPPWMVRPEFDDPDQHAAILLLERLVPSLRDIAFSEGDEGHWIRDHDVWVDQSGFDFASPSERRVLRLFSQVWNADGARRAV
ncbi:hypothetical protein DFH06DRAFT_358801 [Mycena polygramma]|nr:hypothetical protein DFH06DRAFT_358801 [Mycena polygramma]